MKKRILSALTALCLCLTLLPAAAFADEGGSAAPTTPARDCATEGHIDTDSDNKCDACGIGIWFTWADEAHTTKSGKGTWTFSEDGTLTILGTGPIEIYQKSEETPWFQCLASVKKLVIGEGITRAGASSFSGSSNLTEVILPDSLTEIGTATFLSCTALTTLRIPKGVTTIESGAFSDCEKLEAFEVDEANTHFFSEDGVLFRRNFTVDPGTNEETTTPTGTFTLVSYAPGKTDTSYTIPAGVTTILGEAFRAADRLTELSLPASLTSISSDDLSKCSNLTTIHVAEGNANYKSIGGVLFSADGTKLICYPQAKAGSSYTIPGGVKEIGVTAFFNATALTSVTIPEGVTDIGEEAFIFCDALREVTIPASVTSIDEQAFVACTSLTAIHVAAESTAYQSIDGVLFSADGTKLLCCPIAKTGSYTVPAGVETIEARAFSQSNLTSVSLPEGVETINGYAFLGAEKLVSAFLPASVTSIEAWAFSACYSLKHVYFAGSESDWNGMTIPDKDGWFGEEDTTNTCIAIDEDVTTIRYDFDGKLTVTLNPNGGTLREGTEESWQVEYHTASEKPQDPDFAPDRIGYSFLGWSYSVDVYNKYTQTISTTSRIWNWSDPVYQNMDLTAVWDREVDTSHTIAVPDAANGSVRLLRRYAEPGETVTFAVAPGEGFVLKSVGVFDRYGNESPVTAGADGQCSFVMPDADVTLKVVFAQEETAPAEPAQSAFADVPADSWCSAAVLWAAQRNITAGVSATQFGPERPCTRAQIVTFLWRAAGQPEPQGTENPFADISSGDAYYKAVLWAAEKGITGGSGAATFRPDDTCTRAQAVTFLFRFAALQGMDAVTLQELVSGYGDAAEVPGYALPAFNWALANGIVQGASGSLAPNGSCTRAQIVTMLYRLLGETL